MSASSREPPPPSSVPSPVVSRPGAGLPGAAPTSAPPRHPGIAAEWLAVALGGAIGASLRVAMSAVVDPGPEPTALRIVGGTLACNLLGALALGALLGWLETRPAPALARPFLAVGVLGSFTTWSTLVAEGDRLTRLGGPGLAALYAFGSLGLGLLAVALGLRLTRRRGRGGVAG